MKRNLQFFSVVLCCLMFFHCSNKNSQRDNTAVQPDSLKLYFIALEDSGRSGKLIGCNDSAVSVPVFVADSDNPVEAAFDTLLNVDTRMYRGTNLYNALYRSELYFSRIQNTQSVTKIFLAGEHRIGGVCDNPRVQSQLRLTALQFSSIDSVAFFINSIPLHEILSLR
ncbi:MAG: hypothetical protein GF372_14635 [Candidatus Marinimicrobia bacterium]|nr:hypothetical protein [Candidatus Neomarinimicrobiota bacterium]